MSNDPYDVVANSVAQNTILWDGVSPVPLEPNQSLLPYSKARARAPRPVDDGNRETMAGALQAAMTANRTYAALASPTTAQQTAQVKALTQQTNQIIRLLLGVLDGTS